MKHQIANSKWISSIVGWALLLIAATALSAEKVTFYHNDALGSPVAATDQAGNVIWRETYRPFGSQVRQFPVDNDLWYTGKPHNAALGLSYFGARWYDPDIGRFTGVDPVDGVEESPEHLFNRYAYANNNPYRYVDPDGELPVIALIFVAVDFYQNYQDTGNIAEASLATLAGVANPFKKVATTARALKSVTKSVKPAISPQKQAGHIPGTPQNANRLKQGKPTSSFFGEKSGNHLTQQAFEKGKPVPGRPNVREHDFGVSTGTGPSGGMQARVRVHQDSKGRIHGHPSGPERF